MAKNQEKDIQDDLDSVLNPRAVDMSFEDETEEPVAPVAKVAKKDDKKPTALEYFKSDEGQELVRRGNTAKTIIQKCLKASGTHADAHQVGKFLAKHTDALKAFNIELLLKNWC